MTAQQYIAIDLGAESGRVILAAFDGARLHLQEAHRFPNVPVRTPDGLHWDVLRLFAEIKQGIARAVAAAGSGTGAPQGKIASIGIDTWGVDFALLDHGGALLGEPYHYRDARTNGLMERAFGRVPRERIFELSGIQFMQFNTLYQLFAMAEQGAPALRAADTLLMIPDLFNFWLTGTRACEFTDATTTQCYDPRRCEWSDPLLEALGIPRAIFPEIIQPGTRLGPLLRHVAEETGAGRAAVIAPACHDTGSAVAAVPAGGRDIAWLSSGTWSILGTEVRQPVISEAALASNFTNEGGIDGTFRLCTNIAGLWLVQECRRHWAAQGDDVPYAALVGLAGNERPFAALVDPNSTEFLAPGSMPARIQACCWRTRQPVPESRGAIVRCALESLALKYRWALEQLDRVAGKRLETLHIVGGGSRNSLLNQFTANATGRLVLAGPAEATSAGNVLAQAIARGDLASVAEGRRLIRESFDITEYQPRDTAAWDDAYGRFLELFK